MTRTCLASLLILAFCPTLALADSVKARLQWTPEQMQALAFARAGKPIALKGGTVDLTFSDPRRKNETKRILLDPTYRPGTAEAADFFIDTAITPPGSGKPLSEGALCYWNPSKSLATCQIEDDGGRFQIRVVKRGDILASSRFEFVIRKMDGYSGFRIAADEDKKTGEPIAIDVKLKQATHLAAPITF